MSLDRSVVWWSELLTRDIDAAVTWYGTVCGWDFVSKTMPEGQTYRMAMAGGQPVAGFVDMTEFPALAEAPSHWLTYLAVPDIDAALSFTRETGCVVIRGPDEVQGVGHIALVTDPSGATVGLIMPAAA